MLALLLPLFSFPSPPVHAHFNEPLAFVIGNFTPAGAVEVRHDSHLDLKKDCGPPGCPSMVVFAGEQGGTIEVEKCQPGQLYMFVNKSKKDIGIIVQHKGGQFGARAINQYDLGSCFCYHRTEEDDKLEYSTYEDIMYEEKPEVETDKPNEKYEMKGQGGILLCR